MDQTDEAAKLPIIAAYFYDHLVEQNPALGEIMNRQDYIDSFLRWQGSNPILITESKGNC